MFEIMPEHKLRRDGGWINAGPKWQNSSRNEICAEKNSCPSEHCRSQSWIHPAPGTGAAHPEPRAALMEAEKIKLQL